MRSLDVHTHVLPPELPLWSPIRLERVSECRARMLREDGSVFREIASNCWDATQRLQECDEAGVGVQVLSTVPVLFAYQLPPERGHDLARLLNDSIASLCREHPRRFIGLGTLPLQSPDLALRELDRCIGELGLAGIEIGSHVNAWNLSDPALFPVFARAAGLG
ncbi:MAG: amidohydrolase, partial [Deltaproteobacteria bacterium]